MNPLWFPEPPPGWKRRAYIGFGALVIMSVDVAVAIAREPAWLAVTSVVVLFVSLVVLGRQVV